ncbi:hypothetical protein B5M42_007310 [Paenibacillus athensensis]|uniref:Uncharacterized protein n=1 Tax=Paenibacillus athensensis TaxID=1967502 RepID=A0A4Y8Q3I1_9BACL|nr:hypothetical protein [Paenibacillus athensensis]MCD1258640.1 hypothetical protein [Paenibacillus athensensis]
MPDWSYHALFRPLLFRLPSRTARALTLGAMGALSRLPGGTFVIRTMGHVELAPQLAGDLSGIAVPTPVGLSGGLDPHGVAHKALAQFGFGFVELGPITTEPVIAHAPIGRDAAAEALVYPSAYENDGVAAFVRRLQRGAAGHRLPQLCRVRPMPGRTPELALAELERLMTELAPYAAGFYIDGLAEGWSVEVASAWLTQTQQAARAVAPGRPLWVYVPVDYGTERLARLLASLDAAAWSGAVVGDAAGGGLAPTCAPPPAVPLAAAPAAASTPPAPAAAVLAAADLAPALALTSQLRASAPGWTVIAAAGVHQPDDALRLLAAGADAVQLHSGLVFAGPGLPKRIGEAVLYERVSGQAAPPPPSYWRNWGWMSLMGCAMMLGGWLAWLIAATTVLLPYDETFLGAGAQAIRAFNERILHFMTHDRITLAGTMISIGIMYYSLANYGLRYGSHWAATAMNASAVVGFSSFFLFLGYGYFDPLHAAVAVLLLPMFLLSLRRRRDLPSRRPPNRFNDRLWRRAQVGQFCLVTLGFALGAGGLAIAGVGVTSVFVPTDIVFIGMDTEQLQAWNAHLVPLVAHDRAGFGGALFSLAVAITASALWGVGQGERWLWWMFLLGGLPGFASGWLVHIHIGYTNSWHLLPLYIAFVLYAAGLWLLYPYLKREAPAFRAAEAADGQPSAC